MSAPKKLSTEERDLLKEQFRILHTAYCVFLVLGFRVFASAFGAWLGLTDWRGALDGPRNEGKLFGVSDGLTLANFAWFVLAANVMLLGLRFFWCPGNIHRLLSRRWDGMTDRVKAAVVTVHVPCLMAHALGFYLICISLSGSLAEASPYSAMMGVLFSSGVFLLMNAAWLAALTHGEGRLDPESVWIKSNSWCGVLLIGMYVVGRYADSRTNEDAMAITGGVAVSVLLFNNIWDLLKTWPVYLGRRSRQTN